MSSISSLLLEIRTFSSQEISNLVYLLNSEPLNDVMIPEDVSIDEQLLAMRQVEKAFLLDALEHLDDVQEEEVEEEVDEHEQESDC